MNSYQKRDVSRTSAVRVDRGQQACGHINRWHILDVVKAVRTDLSLVPRDITALRAMLSVLPQPNGSHDASAVDPSGMLMVYASNNMLVQRADGMNVRTLGRAISSLIEAGLICRHSSSSGKRFPLRRGGEIIGAFGIDLAPLFARIDELSAIASRNALDAQECAAIRSQMLADRKRWIDSDARRDPDDSAWVAYLHVILRRKLTVIQMRALAANMARITTSEPPALPPQTPEETGVVTTDMSTSDGQNVQHIESQTIRNIKSSPKKEPADASQNPINAYRQADHIKAFFPNEPRTLAALQDVVFQVSSYFNLRNPEKAIANIGWYHMIRVLDYLCHKSEEIRSPQNYLSRIIDTSMISQTVLGEPV